MSRYAQVKVTLLHKDLDELTSRALKEGMKAAAFIRNLLGYSLKEKDERKPSNDVITKIILHKIDTRLLYEINKIGINTNQIAKSLNQIAKNQNQIPNIDLLIVLNEINSKIQKFLEKTDATLEKLK